MKHSGRVNALEAAQDLIDQKLRGVLRQWKRRRDDLVQVRRHELVHNKSDEWTIIILLFIIIIKHSRGREAYMSLKVSLLSGGTMSWMPMICKRGRRR